MEQQENRRIEFIDLTKGLCIMLVVMMHVGGAFDGLATGPVLSSFTMPLYFFVSGLFFKSYEGFGGFLARKVDKLLVPFLIFYLGAFLLMYGISKAVPGTFRLPVRWNELLLIFRNHELIRRSGFWSPFSTATCCFTSSTTCAGNTFPRCSL